MGKRDIPLTEVTLLRLPPLRLNGYSSGLPIGQTLSTMGMDNSVLASGNLTTPAPFYLRV